MTRKISDAELEGIDGGYDQIQQNDPTLAPKDHDTTSGTGTVGGPGGGVFDDIQQDGEGPDADA